MLTSKQKSFLKSMANKIKPTFQIGKDGINTNMKYDIVAHLHKNELMKVSILNNSEVTFDEATEIFNDVNIEVVQTIGNVLVLYKPNKKLKNHIILPKE